MGASGRWAGGADGLVGRDDTLDQLRSFVDEGDRTALVVGIPGAGKSSVLTGLRRAAAADGWVIRSASGHQADRDLPFALLADLLPIDGLPLSEPLALRRAVLESLEAEAGDRSLLVVVDDAHWCDESSLAVLGFIANRLSGSGVSLVAAARDDQVPAVLVDHPRVDLRPLTDRESELVIRRAGIDLDSLTRPSVIERAAGNPLALLELARAAAAGEVGVFASSVESLFADEVKRLPDTTRSLLVLAAAGTGDLAILGRALGADQLVADLAPAERTGLVRVVDRELRFRHPLARSAAYSCATTLERVSAHRQLADAYADDPDRQVWHRAEAAVVPDETVARQLVDAADRARQRGAHVEAARALTRAAELSPDRHDRDMRRLDAIALGLPAGHVRWLAELARELCDESPDRDVRARASHYLAYALSHTARQDAARRALVTAIEQLVEIDPYEAMGSLSTLAYLTYSSGSDSRLVAAWLARIGSLMRDVTPTPLTAPADGSHYYIDAVIDPLHAPPATLDFLRHERIGERVDAPNFIAVTEMTLGAAAWTYGETGAALERLRRAVEVMQRSNYLAMLPQTLAGLAQVQFDAGLYDDVDRSARILVDLADAANLPYVAAVGRVLAAEVAAVRGDAPTTRGLAEEVLLDLDVGESLAVEAFVNVALGFSALGESDVASCFDHLRQLFRRNGEPVHAHISYLFLADVVAAAVRAGRSDEIRDVMTVADRQLTGAVPRCRFQLARARALVAGDDAEQFHLEATLFPAAGQWPLAHANARLEYGVWLRRRHRPTAARVELRAAHDVFGRLGARPWAEITRTELRAAGITLEPTLSTWNDLTAQERQVVRLAAAGMTNREVAASLYLSPRTVSAHLYNAFPKLGVTARSQLRDIVEARERT
jgi:DNA-binding CsgD family transcriptional regulator/tetratricopeptide (TPR) repeat protein